MDSSQQEAAHRRFPARLHVLLARNAPLGVVIRRGRAKQVCTLLWDRSTDTLSLGQWLKGRIYERRCDLSPDGRYLIYFALSGKWHKEARGSWTAVSVAPYLKAIVLLAKGDAWHGGGLFLSPDRYWVNGGAMHTLLRDSPLVHRVWEYRPQGQMGGECLSVYYPRLLRDGWVSLGLQQSGLGQEIHRFEKQTADGWILRKLAHAEVGAGPGKGVYWDEHVLVAPGSGAETAYPTWEWAELDGRRLVWAQGGRLFAAMLGNHGIAAEQMLYDFNDMVFQEIAAPY
jgi:hypothetical protein